jgi:bifunctional N-acetylglucosamine-1-phosphate-uridyltransferase/glucosamine-1-phosphate-acetyltransferase GlmU-like protein
MELGNDVGSAERTIAAGALQAETEKLEKALISLMTDNNNGELSVADAVATLTDFSGKKGISITDR